MTQPTPAAVRTPVESPDIFGATDVGIKRAENQDSITWEPSPVPAKGRLLIIADGVGGQQDGAIASDMAVRQTAALYYADPSPDVLASLKRAIETANAEIYEAGRQQPSATQMASTIVAAVLLGNRLYVAHVGDSRAYLIRGGKARVLTQDHSWVAEQVRAHVLTPEQARNHPQRNVILRSLGSKADVQVDASTRDLQPGDSVLLSSDGLHGLLSDQELARLAGTLPAAKAVQQLIQLANERGGPDNISAIVVRMPGGRGASVVPPLWALAGGGAALFVLLIMALSILPSLAQNPALTPAFVAIATARPTVVTIASPAIVATVQPSARPSATSVLPQASATSAVATSTPTTTSTSIPPTIGPVVPTTAESSPTTVPNQTSTPERSCPGPRLTMYLAVKSGMPVFSQASEKSDRLGRFDYKAEVDTFGIVPSKEGNIWFLVRYNNQCGYIWSPKDGSYFRPTQPK